jgi:hemoglobin-like flavoprotein
MPASAPAEIVEVAEASYHRCHSDAFFRSFYQRLLASDARIPPMFERTDFTKQTKLLQHSIGLLFVFAKRGNPAILERIAGRHGRAEVNVPADMYPLWVDSLVDTVREYDARCSPAVEQAWRQAVAPGIAYLISRYDAPPSPEARPQ